MVDRRSGIDWSYIFVSLTILELILFSSALAEPSVELLSPYDTIGGKVKVQNGILNAPRSQYFSLRFVGSNFNKSTTLVSFTTYQGSKGVDCSNLGHTSAKQFSYVSQNGRIANIKLIFESPNTNGYFVCLKDTSKSKMSNANRSTTSTTGERQHWVHQGSFNSVKLVIPDSIIIPKWLSIVMVTILIMLSGLFSGLNLGLMSIEPNDLKIIINSGTPKEKRFAQSILPLRKHGNLLLCTLLLGNTLVNSSFTILLDGLTSGVIAVVGSTAAIVVFGEIVPQSICSRYGLAVGAYTIWLTKFFMLLTFLVSFPISKILDFILGKEIGAVYNRQQLLEMLKLQDEYNDLEQDEVGIISGALQYKSKTVEEVMTPIKDVFLLDEDAVLDFKTIQGIIETGYSRIPVYSGERSNIVAVLYVKDLAFVDPDECIPLLRLIKFHNHPVQKVFFDTKLDKMLEEFKKGITHLAVVVNVDNERDGDPVYVALGIVTLEDIIEEIIQCEIVDETDIYVDNVSGKKVSNQVRANRDFTQFVPASEDKQKKIEPQLAYALYQFLSTAIEPFKDDLVSRKILKQLIEKANIVEEKTVTSDQDEKEQLLYCRGCVADFFSLIVQGRVEVVGTNEDLVFNMGPFSAFGIKSLTAEKGQPFVPDYSVRLVAGERYLIMKVSRELYYLAVKMSRLEKESHSTTNAEDFDDMFWTKSTRNRISERNSPIGSMRSYTDEDKLSGETDRLLLEVPSSDHNVMKCTDIEAKSETKC